MHSFIHSFNSPAFSFFSLECGFVSWHGGGRVSPIDYCDLQLANHGEGGTIPKNYGFTFSAGMHPVWRVYFYSVSKIML